eukprot:5360617-Amphidinium_carterae.1
MHPSQTGHAMVCTNSTPRARINAPSRFSQKCKMDCREDLYSVSKPNWLLCIAACKTDLTLRKHTSVTKPALLERPAVIQQ